MIDPYRFGTAGGDPATIFAGGDTGGLWDFTNAATLYADTARTTLATLDGPALGVTDLSGKGYHLDGAATVRRAGYLESGVAHRLGRTASGTLVGSTAGFTGYCAFRLASLTGSSGGDAHSALLGADRFNARVAQALVVTQPGQLFDLRFYGQFDNNDSTSGAVDISAGVDYYASVETTSTEITLRRNGVITGTPLTTVARTCSFHSNGGLWIGCDENGSASGPVFRRLAVGSRLYAALWINRPITTQERTDLNAWFANRAGL